MNFKVNGNIKWLACLAAVILVFSCSIIVFSCASDPKITSGESVFGEKPESGEWFLWMKNIEPEVNVIQQSNLAVERGKKYESYVWTKGWGPMILSVIGSNGKVIASKQYQLTGEIWSQQKLSFKAKANETVSFAIGSGDLDFNFFHLDVMYFGIQGGQWDSADNLLKNKGFESGPVANNFAWEILIDETPESLLLHETGYGVGKSRGRWTAEIARMEANRPIIDQTGISLAANPSDRPYDGNWYLKKTSQRPFSAKILSRFINISSTSREAHTLSVMAKGNGKLSMSIMNVVNGQTTPPSNSRDFDLTGTWTEYTFAVPRRFVEEKGLLLIQINMKDSTDFCVDNVFFGHGTTNYLSNPGFEQGYEGISRTVDHSGKTWWIQNREVDFQNNLDIDVLARTGSVFESSFYAKGEGNLVFGAIGSSGQRVEKTIILKPYWYKYSQEIDTANLGPTASFYITAGSEGVTNLSLDNAFFGTPGFNRLVNPGFEEGPNGNYTIGTATTAGRWRLLSGLSRDIIKTTNLERPKIYGPPPPAGYWVPPGHRWTLEFEDNFDNRSDIGPDWVFWNSWGDWKRRDAILTTEDAWVKDGNLVLRSRIDKRGQIKTAMVATYNDARPAIYRHRFGPGRYFEASVRLDEFIAQGQWFAFWLMDAPATASSYNSDPACGGEIDIVEYIKWHKGKGQTLIPGGDYMYHPAYHMGRSYSGRWSDDPASLEHYGFFDALSRLGINLLEGYNRFGAAWYTDRIVFYLNGHEVFTVTENVTQSEKLGIILSIEVSTTGWGAGANAYNFAEEYYKPYNAGRENFVYIDYVRVFALSDGEVAPN